MSDLISRRAALEIIHTLYPSAPIMRMNRKRWEKKYKPYIECEKALKWLPSAQLTLYGYKIEHLACIARVMEKEGVTADYAVRTFDDMSQMIKMIIEEAQQKVEEVLNG